jgi:hypothetical protein
MDIGVLIAFVVIAFVALVIAWVYEAKSMSYSR